MNENKPQMVKEAGEIAENVSHLGRYTAEKLEQAGRVAGEALRRSDTAIRHAARQTVQTMDEATETATEKIDSTGTYVRVQVQGLFGSLRGLASNHPAALAAGAAALGFLFGSIRRKK